MGCCGSNDKPVEIRSTDPCCPAQVPCDTKASTQSGPLAWFDTMIQNNLAYAKQAKDKGQPIVGIMCEYTPRELIMAAGGLPVCLCGGSTDMIGPAEEDLPANL